MPPPFTVDDYRRRTAELRIVGGAVVSGSFQAFDQRYLLDALECLGPDFVGVTQLRPTVTDEELLALDAAGVRALRFNARRRGPDALADLEALARRTYDLLGWHAELYVDARDLPDLLSTLASVPALAIDHLGLSAEGLPHLLHLVERGARVKASGFGRYRGDVPTALREIVRANPAGLLFGTDLPSTRVRRKFHDADVRLLVDALGEEHAVSTLCDNAMRFYRVGRVPGLGAPYGSAHPGAQRAPAEWYG